jgi:hypothetical protein
MTTFTSPDQARNYILDHDRYAKTCNRQTIAQLRVMYSAKLAADGIQVLIGGPAVMSKDELISALVDHDYPDAAAAREVYYQSVAG